MRCALAPTRVHWLLQSSRFNCASRRSWRGLRKFCLGLRNSRGAFPDVGSKFMLIVKIEFTVLKWVVLVFLAREISAQTNAVLDVAYLDKLRAEVRAQHPSITAAEAR